MPSKTLQLNCKLLKYSSHLWKHLFATDFTYKFIQVIQPSRILENNLGRHSSAPRPAFVHHQCNFLEVVRLVYQLLGSSQIQLRRGDAR